jgi:hypothetical protein
MLFYKQVKNLSKKLRFLLLAFVTTSLMTSCTHGLHLHKGDDSGLMQLGQQMSYERCNKRLGHRDYQACKDRVDETYGELNQK